MVHIQPIRDASTDQLHRWLGEATAARFVRLPDDKPLDQVVDLVWLDSFAAAIRAELVRRGVHQRRTGTDR